MKKVITFGELMLRLAPEGYLRIVQSEKYEATYGGAEANVAVSLANYGIDVSFVSKLPAHEVGQAAINSLRKFGVDTSLVTRGGERVGIYYCEKGASQRPSKVIYDRANSAIATAKKEDFDWDKIFEQAEWFHFTGITPALSDEVAEICEIACKKAKEKGIHTCLDTSGAVYHPLKRKEYEVLLSYTDLVLLDIKHSDSLEHKKLTGHTNESVLGFATLLSELKIPMVIRHVLVPEITDTTEQLTGLGILMKQFPNIVGLEVLPFHQMGTAKYENLGIPYPLKDVPALTKEDAKRARKTILEAFYY